MSEVVFFSSGGGSLALNVLDAAADPLTATQIVARRAVDNVTLGFAQNVQLKLPRILFEPDAGAATTLKTKDALKALANVYVTQAKAKELDALRVALRGLRRFEVTLDMAGQGFFGVASIEGARALSARATVDLAGSLPTDAFLDPPPGLPALHFDATLRATVDVLLSMAPGGAVTANASLALAVGLVIGAFDFQCDFAFDLPDLPALPGLPPLGLRLPRFVLPNLRLATIQLPDLSEVLALRLPAPQLGVTVHSAPAARLVVTNGALTLTMDPIDGALTLHGTPFAAFAGVALTLRAGAPPLAGTISPAAVPPAVPIGATSFREGLPFIVDIVSGAANVSAAGATFDLATGAGHLDLAATFDLRVTVTAKDDPTIGITFDATYKVDALRGGGRLVRLEVVAPYPLPLIADVAADAVDGLIRALALIPLPGAPGAANLLSVLRHIARFVGACARWLARETGGAASALAGLGEGAAALIERLVDALADAGRHIAIEARLDARSFALRQIVLTPVDAGGGAAQIMAGGPALRLAATTAWRPSLLFDLSGPPIVALCVAAEPGADLKLSTDLWLDRGVAGEQEVLPVDGGTPPPPDPLIQVTATRQSAVTVALIVVESGRLQFLQEIVGAGGRSEPIPLPGGANATILLLRDRPHFAAIDVNALAIAGAINPAQAKRLLPFLFGPSSPQLPNLPQSIEIDTPTGPPKQMANGVIVLPLAVTLHLFKTAIKTTLNLSLEIATMRASIQGGDALDIMGDSSALDFLGMSMRILPNNGAALASFPQWRLDFSRGDARLALHPEAHAELAYTRIASKGRGLLFNAKKLVVTRDGIDLDAELQTDAPVQLAGVEQAFRFTKGRLVVERGALRTFTIAGAGQLPPALVGEATANISLTLSQRNSAIVVQSADAELDLPCKQLVCKATCFTFTVDKLGLGFEDFGSGGTHFYFQITGSARFTPEGDQFSSGMLRYLPDLTITLEKAPLTTDARLLKDRIAFQIAVNPTRRIKLFEVFEFELRGFGFRPASPAFAGKPALSISGQVNFLKAGDTISPRFDFHEMWIAPPKDGEALPQIRFDGLGVALSLGGAGMIEATAIAVDGSLPSMLAPNEPGITSRGFLAQGRISITGLAPLSAAMGFLELSDDVNGGTRHAFFIYGQANKLAVRVPLPFFEIWLREAGLGVGDGYTLAGLAAADRVTTPSELVHVLDPLTKMSGELASFEAWHPDSSGNRLTLALHAMFSMACVSENLELAEQEKKLPNPVLFDATVALRSDLTLLMTVRTWLCVNYWRWFNTPTGDELRRRPTLTGYLYLSAPRKILLARMRNNRDGIIGDTPPMYPALKKMFEAVDWSSTLYVAPGVYHQEMGWPYELGFELKDPSDQLYIHCTGGTILRIEDGAVLQGISFKAVGYAKLGGTVGGSSLGASVLARADFEIGGKLITYLSLRRFSDSFYYGALGFTITLQFSVRVWLEFSIGVCDVHLEAGFSVALCVTVALEIAASPQGLGGRGQAQLSVSAFGRTLSLSAGFGFGDAMLDQARAAVDRFMTLGLGTVAPDPEKGLASPPLVQSPKVAVEHADAQAEQAMQEHEALNPPPAPGAAVLQGHSIKPPRFWALLRPLRAAEARDNRDKTYIMTLIPQDTTGDADDTCGSFYAPPFVSGGNYEINSTGGAPTLKRLGFTGAPQPVSTPIFAGYAQSDDNLVAKNGESKVYISDVVRECFVWDPATKTITGQPGHRLIKVLKTPLDPDEAKAEAQLRRASAMMAAASKDEQRDRAIEQRRSSVIAAVHDSIRELAERLDADARTPPPREAVTERGRHIIDARDFGLTFIVSGAELDQLFEGGVDGTPPKGRFHVKTKCRDGEDFTGPGDVQLLNPRDRFFDIRPPILIGASCVIGRDSIALDWDLEPDWRSSSTVYDDPEFHLLHYRISGVAVIDQKSVIPLQRAPITVRAAAPLVLNEENEFQPLRPRAQFTDRLEGEALADLRAAIFGNHWKGRAENAQSVSFEYTVIPVDLAGREGVPRVIAGRKERPAETLQPMARAELIFDYGAMPEPGSDFSWPTMGGRPPFALRLRVDDPPMRPSPARTGKSPRVGELSLPIDGARYRLRLRREATVAAGRYGADAVDEGLARPLPADFEKLLEGDADFTVVMTNGTVPYTAPDGTTLGQGKDRFLFWPVLDKTAASRRPWSEAPYFLLESPVTLVDVMQKLGVMAVPPAEPFAVRAALCRLDPKQDTPASPWIVADLGLRIAPNEKGAQVETAVETFEHPLAFDFDPLHFDDLYGESGRVQVMHPRPDATLSEWLLSPVFDQGNALAATGGGTRAPGAFLRDRARRIGTRIVWNAQPTRSSAGAAADPYAQPGYLGGFDVFTVDLLALGVERARAQDAQRLARVQALPERMKAIDPAEIEDYGALESFYPSQSARLCSWPSAAGNVKERLNGLAPWFSIAETLLDWPAWGPRRSLGLDVEELALSPLFAAGRPTKFKLSLENWPGAAGPKPSLVLWAGAHTERVDPNELVVPVPAGERPPTVLRKALYQLSLHNVDAQIDAKLLEAPKLLDGVKLHIDSDGYLSEPVSLPLTLATQLHPALADVLDRLRWDPENGLRRRFSPVLDGAPATKAQTFAALMAERPAPRDPHGWAVLRTFRLAVGVRLYDIEKAEYCSAEELRERLNAALTDILPRYADSQLAAPFVDLMARPDGLVRLQSLDGRTLPRRGLTEEFDGQALAMVQIALRPLPEGLISGADGDPTTRAARYILVSAPPDVELTLDMNRNALNGLGAGAVVIEAIDLSSGLASPHSVTLAGNGAGSKALCPTGAPEATTLHVTTRSAPEVHGSVPKAPPVLLLRVTTLPALGEALADTASIVEAALGGHNDKVTIEPIDSPLAADENASRLVEAFGVFPALTASTTEALVFGVDDVGGNKIAAPHPHVAKRFDRFTSIARRFDPAMPDPTKRRALIELYLKLAPRLIEHGPGRIVDVTHGAGVSLTALMRPDPWRLPPSSGRIGALFLHDDRYARRHRYIVRPFGRYEHLDAAANGRARGIGDINASKLLPVAGDDDLSNHGVDIVISRTHPIGAPVILSAAAFDPAAENGGAHPGRVIEWVNARHGEAADSVANIRIAARLGSAFAATGLFHGFAGRPWAERLPGAPQLQIEPFGDGKLPGSMPALSASATSFDSPGTLSDDTLTTRLVDGWRGIDAQRLREAPHGVSLFGATFAAAGVVVSDPVAIAFPAPRYSLAFPWAAGAPRQLDSPIWRVEGDGAISITAPLVRYLDGIEVPPREVWGLGVDAPAAFLYPDGAVTYALIIARGGVAPSEVATSGPASTSTEVEWRPFAGHLNTGQGDPDPTTESRYIARASGRRLAARDQIISHTNAWMLTIRLVAKLAAASMTVARPAGDAPADWAAFHAEVARVHSKLESPFAKVLTPFLNITNAAGWEAVCPGTTVATIQVRAILAGTPIFGATLHGQGRSAVVTLPAAGGASMTVTRPTGDTPADWDAFRAEAARVHSSLESPFAKLLAPFLNITDAAGWSAHSVGAMATLPAPDVIAGTPIFGATVPGPGHSAVVTLPAAAGFDWGLPLTAEHAPDLDTLWEAAAVPLPDGSPRRETIANALVALAADPACPAAIGVLMGAKVTATPPDAATRSGLLEALDAVSGVHGLNRRGAAAARAALAAGLDVGHTTTVSIAIPRRLFDILRTALGGWGQIHDETPLALLLHAPPTTAELNALSPHGADLRNWAADAALDQLFGTGMRPLWAAYHGNADAIFRPLGSPA